MAKRTSHLTMLDQISVGERKLEGKKEREKGEERSSTFSLDLTAIGPSAFIGATCRVRPHG